MPAAALSPARFVRATCRLAQVPHVPEIRLYLGDDVLDLWQRTEEGRGPGQPPPFWAFAWPGGQALARYVLDHSELVAGRTVLDLGSGSGLVAIAAAIAGAPAVLASEIDALAVAAIGLNARANGVPVPKLLGDVLDGDGENAGLVLAGDVWYTRPLAERVLAFIERATARGASVLVGDIGRAFLPRDRFRVLQAGDVPVLAELEDSSVKRTMVWAPATPLQPPAGEGVQRDCNCPGGDDPPSTPRRAGGRRGRQP
jgi:predicted nicotinamide N-methyase